MAARTEAGSVAEALRGADAEKAPPLFSQQRGISSSLFRKESQKERWCSSAGMGPGRDRPSLRRRSTRAKTSGRDRQKDGVPQCRTLRRSDVWGLHDTLPSRSLGPPLEAPQPFSHYGTRKASPIKGKAFSSARKGELPVGPNRRSAPDLSSAYESLWRGRGEV